MVKYFAYGSNLDLRQMKMRCPLSKLVSKGSLSGHSLTFNKYSGGWDGGVADVIRGSSWNIQFNVWIKLTYLSYW